MKVIKNFRGEYYFLSNMYPCEIRVHDLVFLNSESLFQALKFRKNRELVQRFCGIDGFTAKSLGKKIRLSSTAIKEWNEFRITAMEKAVRAKFVQNPDLAKKLLATGDAELVEENTWNDTFWGVCNGIGQNNLGKILMKIRNELKSK